MNKEFISPKELRENHPERKRKIDYYKNYWSYLFVRPASFYLAPIFLYFGFTANQVTMLGAIILLVGLAAIGVAGSYTAVILGAILVNVWFILDYVDGVVARHRSTESVFGEFLDWVTGVVERTFLPIVVGVFLYTVPSAVFTTIFFEVQPISWILVALLSVLTRLLRNVVRFKISTLTRNGDNNYNNKPSPEVSSPVFLAHTFRSFKRPMLLVFSIFSAVDIWLILYSIYNILIFLPEIYFNVNRLK